MSGHVYPTSYIPDDADEAAKNRELLDSLFQAYPDFRDVANALIDRLCAGEVFGEFVEAVFVANDWQWPEW